MAEMTPADFAAVTRNNEGMEYGSWFWVIIILFAFMNNGWGNNGFNGFAFNDIARESTMNTQFVERDIVGVGKEVLENRYANQLAECNTQKEVLLGNANLQKDILLGNQTIGANMASCCCEIKNAIRDDGEKTRALITANRIADLEKELTQAQGIIANTAQTQNILNSLGNYYPKQGVNPFNLYGYGYGTTIS